MLQCIAVRFCLCLFLSCTAAIAASPSEKLDRAKSLLDEGHGQESTVITLVNQALESAASARAYNYRGIAYSRLGNHKQAIHDYTQAIKLDPDYAKAYHNRAQSYVDIQRYELALNDFDQALRVKSDYSEVYMGKSRALAGMGKIDEAIAASTRAVELLPSDPVPLSGRSLLYVMTGNIQQAETDCLRSLKIQDSLEGNFACASVYTQLKDYSKSIEHYDRAVSLDDSFVEAYPGRAVARLALGNYSGAVSDLNIVLDSSPSAIEAYVYRGYALKGLNDLQAACNDWKSYLKLRSGNNDLSQEITSIVKSECQPD